MAAGSRRLRAVLALLVLACAFLTTACGDPRVDGHRLYTQRKGVARFSFEYSDKYVKDRDDTSGSVTSVLFTRTYREADSASSFTFFIAGVGVYAKSAHVYLEQELADAQNNAPDFKLLYISGLDVAGVTGTQLVYTYRRLPPPDWGGSRESWAVVKKVFFETDGVIWEIYLDAFADTAVADMADFDHVLETLRILH